MAAKSKKAPLKKAKAKAKTPVKASTKAKASPKQAAQIANKTKPTAKSKPKPKIKAAPKKSPNKKTVAKKGATASKSNVAAKAPKKKPALKKSPVDKSTVKKTKTKKTTAAVKKPVNTKTKAKPPAKVKAESATKKTIAKAVVKPKKSKETSTDKLNDAKKKVNKTLKAAAKAVVKPKKLKETSISAKLADPKKKVNKTLKAAAKAPKKKVNTGAKGKNVDLKVTAVKATVRATTKPSGVKKPITFTTNQSAAETLRNLADVEAPAQKFDADYMNEAQREHFKEMLLHWKLQLMEEVDRTVSNMKDVAANDPDPADRATQEEEFSLELRTRDRERKLIKKIDKTIDLIDQDDYGYCDSCGIEIGYERLEARPTATQCIDCKTLDEIKEKQIHG